MYTQILPRTEDNEILQPLFKNRLFAGFPCLISGAVICVALMMFSHLPIYLIFPISSTAAGFLHLFISRDEDGFTFCGMDLFRDLRARADEKAQDLFDSDYSIVRMTAFIISGVLIVNSYLVAIFCAAMHSIGFVFLMPWFFLMAGIADSYDSDDVLLFDKLLCALAAFTMIIAAACSAVFLNIGTIARTFSIEEMIFASSNKTTEEPLDPFENISYERTGEEGIELIFSGISPEASLQIRNQYTRNDPRSQLIYSASQVSNIKRNDEITLNVTPTKGYVYARPDTTSMKVDTSHLSAYLTDASFLDTDHILEVQAISYEKVKDHIAIGLLRYVDEKPLPEGNIHGISMKTFYVLSRKDERYSMSTIYISFLFKISPEDGSETQSYIGCLRYQDKENPPMINEDNELLLNTDSLIMMSSCFKNEKDFEENCIYNLNAIYDISSRELGMVVEE